MTCSIFGCRTCSNFICQNQDLTQTIEFKLSADEYDLKRDSKDWNKQLKTSALAALVELSGPSDTSFEDLAKRRIEDIRKSEDSPIAAIEMLTETLQNNPTSLGFHLRAQKRLAINNLEEALEDNQRALKMDSQNPELLEQRGIILKRLNRQEEAVLDYALATEIAFTKEASLINMESLLKSSLDNGFERTDSFEEALSSYTQRIKEDPKEEWLYLNRGDLYAQFGQIDNAFKDYRKALKLTPREPYASKKIADLYKKTGKVELAIAEYSKALKISPDYSTILLSRGELYALQGNFEEAVKDFTKVEKLDPSDRDDLNLALLQRGRVYKKLGKIEKARSDFASIVSQQKVNELERDIRTQTQKINSSEPSEWELYEGTERTERAYTSRGSAYLQLKQYHPAIADFSLALAIEKKSETFRLRALAYKLTKKHQMAVNDLNEAIAINSQKQWSIYNFLLDRAENYLQMGQESKALSDFDEALSIEPNKRGAYISIARMYLNKGLPAKALPCYDKLCELIPYDYWPFVNRAKTNFLLSNFEQVVKDLDCSIAIQPSAEAYMIRGNAKKNLGQLQEAIADYESALELLNWVFTLDDNTNKALQLAT